MMSHTANTHTNPTADAAQAPGELQYNDDQATSAIHTDRSVVIETGNPTIIVHASGFSTPSVTTRVGQSVVFQWSSGFIGDSTPALTQVLHTSSGTVPFSGGLVFKPTVDRAKCNVPFYAPGTYQYQL